MTRKWANTVFSVLAVVGLFMPIASVGSVHITLDKLGGVALLLYLVPFALLGLSILAIYKPQIPHLKVWLTAGGVAGIVLAVVCTFSGMNQVRVFVASVMDFEIRKQQFEEAFDQGREMILNGTSQIGNRSQPEKPKAAPPVPPASPDSGAILLVVGFIGVTLSTVTARRAVATALLAFLALSSTTGAEAARKGGTAAKSVGAESPKPFGLVFGTTGREETRSIFENQGSKVADSGYRVIKDDLTNPDVTAYVFKGISMEGVTSTTVWFFKDRLMLLDYSLSGSFETYYDQLREKYGAPSSSKRGFGGEAHASWKFKDVELSLDKPFMGGMSMTYRHGALYRQSKDSDQSYYAAATKEKAKAQKGF